MPDKKPSPEQIKEVWEWCDQISMVTFTTRSPLDRDLIAYHKQLAFKPAADKNDNTVNWEHFDWAGTIDLNNLFKYAVPKAIDKIITKMKSEGEYASVTAARQRLFNLWQQYWTMYEDSTALFWAIWEVIHAR